MTSSCFGCYCCTCCGCFRRHCGCCCSFRCLHGFAGISTVAPVHSATADATAVTVTVLRATTVAATKCVCRLQALRELARITRCGGRILIYVWYVETLNRVRSPSPTTSAQGPFSLLNTAVQPSVLECLWTGRALEHQSGSVGERKFPSQDGRLLREPIFTVIGPCWSSRILC